MEPTTPEGALDYSVLIDALRGAGRAAKQFVLPDPPDHSVVDDFPLPGEDQFAFMGRQARSPKWSQKVMEGATMAAPIFRGYHGGPAGLTSVDPSAAARRHYQMMEAEYLRGPKGHKGVSFFSSNPEVAETYRRAARGEYGVDPASIYMADIDLANPLVVDAAGAHWKDVVPDTIKRATGEGYDGAVVKNVSDSALKQFANLRGDTIAALDPNQIRLFGEFSPDDLVKALRDGTMFEGNVGGASSLADLAKVRRPDPKRIQNY